MRFFAAILVIFTPLVSQGNENFNAAECEKILAFKKEIDYPIISYEISNVHIGNQQKFRSEFSSRKGLIYSNFNNPDFQINFSDIDSDLQDNGTIAMAEYWGVESISDFASYWDSLELFVKGLNNFHDLDCIGMSDNEKLELIVSISVYTEVLLIGIKSALVAYNFNDSYYYVISELKDGTFIVELKIKLDQTVHTVTLKGLDRIQLEAFVLEIISLNSGSRTS